MKKNKIADNGVSSSHRRKIPLWFIIFVTLILILGIGGMIASTIGLILSIRDSP